MDLLDKMYYHKETDKWRKQTTCKKKNQWEENKQVNGQRNKIGWKSDKNKQQVLIKKIFKKCVLWYIMMCNGLMPTFAVKVATFTNCASDWNIFILQLSQLKTLSLRS